MTRFGVNVWNAKLIEFESMQCVSGFFPSSGGYCTCSYRSILCLTSRTTVTSPRITEDACHRARYLCVFSSVQKGTPGLTHKGCVLPRVSLGALRDVTVVLRMRQSIPAYSIPLKPMNSKYTTLSKLFGIFYNSCVIHSIRRISIVKRNQVKNKGTMVVCNISITK